ncbi:MAG: DUF1080 domain-containing protein [Planctomycetota bacterium]|nr:DUF1080 domain-containing protein [Planctomycetota bacterium]
MFVLIRCLAVAVAFSATTLFAADPNAVVFTDPAKAGIDYELQGEYAGTVKTGEEDLKIGVQIIALGDGAFQAVGFIGGLPGDGWSRGDKSHTAEGKLENGRLRFTTDSDDGKVTAEVKDGSIVVYGGNAKVAEFTKVHRHSPTLGAKPPEGAVVLFDGSSTDAWEGGELIDGKWLGAQNIATKEKFGDHQLHLEFQTPFMPTARGQGRGNSGVYVQSRYEVQVLDSFGLEGKNNECGGIYSIAEPIVNMCFPPLSWQTYDVEFTAARYDDSGKKVKNARTTIRHNGVVIHDDLEITHGTPGRHEEGPEPDGLFLQNHGNPVVFRNIWIAKK